MMMMVMMMFYSALCKLSALTIKPKNKLYISKCCYKKFTEFKRDSIFMVFSISKRDGWKSA